MDASPSASLSPERAKRVYDRWGGLLDWNEFYERHAVDLLLAHSGLESARAVFEFGCGTGRLAERLLRERLSPSCRYRAVDLSDTMVALARARLAPYADRATVASVGPESPLEVEPESFDRFLSTFVFDVLSAQRIQEVLAEAHRALVPGGKLCLTSLWRGDRGIRRFTAWCWERLYAVSPSLLGGCRPLSLLDDLADSRWRIDTHVLIAPFGLPSGVVVATRL